MIHVADSILYLPPVASFSAAPYSESVAAIFVSSIIFSTSSLSDDDTGKLPL